jgi:hypothetical protein
MTELAPLWKSVRIREYLKGVDLRLAESKLNKDQPGVDCDKWNSIQEFARGIDSALT